MDNNENQENEKKVPYFKRKDSIYQKHPFIAWAITIIVIVGGLYLVYSGTNEMKKNASYNAGYRDALK